MIQFVDVSKQYGKKYALKNVTFTASESDITGIIGHNGAGKTSLFMIANGLSKPTDGDVLINDIALSKNLKSIQSITGIFTDRLYLYPNLTVKECLSFFIGVYKADKTQYDYLVDAFQLREHEHKKFAALSTGLQKRVKLAVAIINKPRVLFLDEPFSGLDPESRYSFIQLIKSIQKDDIQIMISSHELLELETLINRIVLLRNGCIIADDYLDNLMASNFQEHTYQVEIYSKDIDALISYLGLHNIVIQKSYLRNMGNDTYLISLQMEDYIKIEYMQLPDSRILSVSSYKPTLDDLYFRLNISYEKENSKA